MKIIEEQLHYNFCYGVWVSDENEFITDNALISLFEIPYDVLTIWVSLHTRAAKNRIPVRFISDTQIQVGDLIYHVYGYEPSLIERIGKTLYLEVTYEC